MFYEDGSLGSCAITCECCSRVYVEEMETSDLNAFVECGNEHTIIDAKPNDTMDEVPARPVSAYFEAQQFELLLDNPHYVQWHFPELFETDDEE